MFVCKLQNGRRQRVEAATRFRSDQRQRQRVNISVKSPHRWPDEISTNPAGEQLEAQCWTLGSQRLTEQRPGTVDVRYRPCRQGAGPDEQIQQEGRRVEVQVCCVWYWELCWAADLGTIGTCLPAGFSAFLFMGSKWECLGCQIYS